MIIDIFRSTLSCIVTGATASYQCMQWQRQKCLFGLMKSTINKNIFRRFIAASNCNKETLTNTNNNVTIINANPRFLINVDDVVHPYNNKLYKSRVSSCCCWRTFGMWITKRNWQKDYTQIYIIIYIHRRQPQIDTKQAANLL